MATTLFLDTFTGGAGALNGHTPDFSPAPNTWNAPPDTLALDGAGKAIPTTPALFTQSVSTAQPTVAYDITGGFVLEADIYSIDTTGSAHPVGCGVGGVFSTRGAVSCSGDGASGIVARASVEEDGGFTRSFSDVPVSIGLNTLKLSVSGLEARFFINGVQVQAITLDFPSYANASAVTLNAYANGTDTDYGVSRILLTSFESFENSAFWTNFNGTFEIA
jgi:hypothetical protein